MACMLLVMTEGRAIGEHLLTNSTMSFVFYPWVDNDIRVFLLGIVFLLLFFLLLHIGVVLSLSLHYVIRLIPALLGFLSYDMMTVNDNLVSFLFGNFTTFYQVNSFFFFSRFLTAALGC